MSRGLSTHDLAGTTRRRHVEATTWPRDRRTRPEVDQRRLSRLHHCAAWILISRRVSRSLRPSWAARRRRWISVASTRLAVRRRVLTCGLPRDRVPRGSGRRAQLAVAQSRCSSKPSSLRLSSTTKDRRVWRKTPASAVSPTLATHSACWTTPRAILSAQRARSRTGSVDWASVLGPRRPPGLQREQLEQEPEPRAVSPRILGRPSIPERRLIPTRGRRPVGEQIRVDQGQ